ncbi:MAG: ribonuclease HII [Candidatus Margulisiibacteriota bacterium]
MPHFLIERKLMRRGKLPVAGVDEAGRGPLAGPVFAAAVILDPDLKIEGLDDSKKLSPSKREALCYIIKRHSLSWAVSKVSEKRIDRINILNASLLAMKKALAALSVKPGYALVDGNRTIPGLDIGQLCVVKGDAISVSIAAASILAKVERDRQMKRLHDRFPDYGFDVHKGYGTSAHMKAIKKHGPCACHRMTFEPVRSCRLQRTVVK